MLSIVPLPFAGVLYHDSVALRERVLRQPLGIALRPEDVAEDALRQHFGALWEQTLVGTVSLAVQGAAGRIKQMAVHPEHQQQGIGQLLLAAAEDAARQQGMRRMVLHARETARGFYERLGYTAFGEAFTEVALPHIAMEKAL